MRAYYYFHFKTHIICLTKEDEEILQIPSSQSNTYCIHTMTFDMKGIDGNALSVRDRCSLNYVWLACCLT